VVSLEKFQLPSVTVELGSMLFMASFFLMGLQDSKERAFPRAVTTETLLVTQLDYL
jgi:hypothetical protein